MLMSFGTFWGAEGVGVDWALKEPTILILAALYWLTSLVLISMLKRSESAVLQEATA